jgi:carbon-monoxide dehydrogenase medium subunit
MSLYRVCEYYPGRRGGGGKENMTPFQIKGFAALPDLVKDLAAFQGKIGFVAGGTDFVNRVRRGELDCDLVVDLSQMTDLRYISEETEHIRIGAGTTFAEIASHPLIRKKAPCLAEAASQVGSIQIRNRATIGGNVASASPAADSMPPLTVLNAKARILAFGPAGVSEVPERKIDLCGTTLSRNELIKEIYFPIPPSHGRSAFQKIGSRTCVSISKLSMAMAVHFDPGKGVIEEGAIALGALGEEPVCPDDLRDFFAGQHVDREFARRLVGRLVDIVAGAIPERVSRPYKMSAVRGLTADILARLFGTSFDLNEGPR